MGRVEYVVCPVCGFNRVAYSWARAEKGKESELRWATWFTADGSLFFQVREGGGKQPGTGGGYRGSAKGIGFKIIEEESLTLIEAHQDPETRKFVEGLKDRVLEVVSDLLHNEIISKDDLEPLLG